MNKQMRTATTIAAATLAALILPGVLAAQNQPAGNPTQQSQGQTQQPATPPAQTAPAQPAQPAMTPAAPEAQKVQQDAQKVIKEEKKTEADELKMLKDQEGAETSAVKAQKLPVADEKTQLAGIKKTYESKRRSVTLKYHEERQETRKEMAQDIKKDAKPAGQ